MPTTCINYYYTYNPSASTRPFKVELIYYYPDINTIDKNYGVTTIGSGIEYQNVEDAFNVNMFLTKMVITFTRAATWNIVPFNGFVCTSKTYGATLHRPAYFKSSTIDTALMTLSSTTTTITLNWEGVHFTPVDTIVIAW